MTIASPLAAVPMVLQQNVLRAGGNRLTLDDDDGGAPVHEALSDDNSVFLKHCNHQLIMIETSDEEGVSNVATVELMSAMLPSVDMQKLH